MWMLKVEFSEGTIDGITVYVDIADTIDTAKTKIEGQTGIPKASQRILFGGRPIAAISNLGLHAATPF